MMPSLRRYFLSRAIFDCTPFRWLAEPLFRYAAFRIYFLIRHEVIIFAITFAISIAASAIAAEPFH